MTTQIARFRIGSVSADPSAPLFLRLEVEPDTSAHRICAATPVLEGTRVSFGGAIVIDTDAGFLEIHPDEDFRIDA